MKTVFKGFICMNNTRYEVFSCLKKQLIKVRSETHTYDQFMTLMDMTLQYLQNHIDDDEIYPVTRKQLLENLQEKGKYLQEIDAQKFIKPNKIQEQLEQIIFLDQRPIQPLMDLGYIPILVVNKSTGGRGKSSYFYFDIKEISSSDYEEVIDNEDDDEFKQDISIIHYQRKIPKQIKPALLIRLFFNDGELKMYSIKGFLFMITMMLSFVFDLLIVIYAILVILFIRDIAITLWQAIVILVFIPFAYLNWFYFFRPLNNLITHRIVKAPMFFININVDNAEIEFFREKYTRKEQAYNVARLTEITATCPICTAPIILADGKPDQKAPLVGRCKEAPHAHVYSFDRMTMKGYFLGHQGYLTEN